MDRVAEPLELMGAPSSGVGRAVPAAARVKGGALHGIDWTTKVASAQVKSAILLAGLAAEGPTMVRERVTTRAHTEEMLAEAGVDITVEPWGEGRIVTLHPSPLRPVTPADGAGRPLGLGVLRGGRVRGPGQQRRRWKGSIRGRPGWATSRSSSAWGRRSP